MLGSFRALLRKFNILLFSSLIEQHPSGTQEKYTDVDPELVA